MVRRYETTLPCSTGIPLTLPIELLAPPALFDPYLSDTPDIRDALHARERLDLSLEACLRRMIERRDEPLAVVFPHEGRVRYVIRNDRLPFVPLNKGDRVPGATHASVAIAGVRTGTSEPEATISRAWIGQADLDMREQTRLTQTGYAVTLLQADLPEDAEDDGAPPELGTPRFR